MHPPENYQNYVKVCLFFKVQAFKNEGERKEGITAIQIWKEVNGGKQWWGKPRVNHSYTLGFLKRSGGNAGYLWKWGWSGRLKLKKLVESLRSNWIPRWMFGGFFSGLEDKAQLQVGLSYKMGLRQKTRTKCSEPWALPCFAPRILGLRPFILQSKTGRVSFGASDLHCRNHPSNSLW